MKVKEIAALAAANMGRDELVSQINNAASPSGEMLSLLRCYNLVENEIAIDYIPLKRQEKIACSQNGEIAFSSFSLFPANVYRVLDGRGRNVKFRIFPDRLQTELFGGEATVVYSYIPVQKGWEDESEYGGRVSARLMSFGLACEFCLSRGQFAEASVWQNRYLEGLRSANERRGRLAVRSRRWA